MTRSRCSKQTREKCRWNSEKLREERRAELVSIFKYLIPTTNPRTSRRKNCSCQNVCKKMGVGGFYTLVMSVWLCEREGSVDANCQNWPIIWTGIPEYGIKNNAYKHSFLSLPGPLAVFAQLFSICFPCYLAAWNRLNANLSPRDLSMVAGLCFGHEWWIGPEHSVYIYHWLIVSCIDARWRPIRFRKDFYTLQICEWA